MHKFADEKAIKRLFHNFNENDLESATKFCLKNSTNCGDQATADLEAKISLLENAFQIFDKYC